MIVRGKAAVSRAQCPATFALLKHHGYRKCSYATCRVYHNAAGKVHDTKSTQPAVAASRAAPDPVGHGVVNEERPCYHHDDKRLKRELFCPSTRQYDGRHEGKHHLKGGEERRGNGLAAEAGVPWKGEEHKMIKRVANVAPYRGVSKHQAETNKIPHHASDDEACLRATD